MVVVCVVLLLSILFFDCFDARVVFARATTRVRVYSFD